MLLSSSSSSLLLLKINTNYTANRRFTDSPTFYSQTEHSVEDGLAGRNAALILTFVV